MGVYLRVAAFTDIGRVREKNEDAFVAADLTRRVHSDMPEWSGRLDVGQRGALLAISDGVGGAAAGEVAAALAISSLEEALSADGASDAGGAEIIEAVQGANRTVWAERSARGMEMGATLTAVVVRDAEAYVAEVGDSRAYLLRAGRITQLTKDQSYVQMLVDIGAVEPARAHEAPLRNLVLQAMGHRPSLKVALGRLELRRRDCLLLCSDGLSNEVNDAEMRDVVLSSPDLPTAANRLIALANERGGRDNTTVVLGGVGGDLPAPDPGEAVERTYQVLETFDGS